MLEAERLDVVDICSPPRTHADIAIRSLKAGAHALIEKPMAINTEECDRIIAAAKENGRKICVAHSDLFYPSFLKARELVKAGNDRRIPRHAHFSFDACRLHYLQARPLGAPPSRRRHRRDRPARHLYDARIHQSDSNSARRAPQAIERNFLGRPTKTIVWI